MFSDAVPNLRLLLSAMPPRNLLAYLYEDGLCTSRAIPIKTTLHYAVPEDGYPAAKERTNNGKMKLLTLHDDMEHVLKGGKGLIRCRINDVSKNHMGNGFVIKASADHGTPSEKRLVRLRGQVTVVCRPTG